MALLRRVWSAADRYWRDCPATMTLLSLFVVTHVLQILLVALVGFDRANDVFYFGSDWAQKPWTVILSHLGHSTTIPYHLLANFGAAIFILPIAERAAGRALFLSSYWTAAILGSFLKLNLTGVESVGASSGLLAVFGFMCNAFLMPGATDPKAPFWARPFILLPGFLLVFLSLNVSIVRQVGHASHWYGFAMGGLFALIHAAGLLAKPSLAQRTRPPMPSAEAEP